jgi:diguanylate cyclase (GGDEF)-like protein
MGISNGLIVNIFALSQHGGNVFLVLLTVDIVVSVIRFQIAHRAAESTARGLPWATDTYLRVAFAWCALQGAMAFFAMISEIAPVQFLSGISVMGLVGPLCARNFAAPRWALLLSATLVLPMVIGGLATGRSWALILVLQLPIFLVGCSIVIRRFQGLAVATLLAQAKSHRDATHDALTGLMNRHGLIGALSQAPWSKADWDAQTGYVAFYLDLDGFKGVNDRLGHHAGDQLLVEIASRLRSCCKPDDILGRIGGDEFVIVRPWATPREAHVFADRMIRRIAHQPLRRVIQDENPASIRMRTAPPS